MSLLNTLKDKPLDFWIKWSASVLTLVHVYVTAHDFAPYYKFTGIACSILWTILGILWRQPSVYLLNAILVLIYIVGIFGL
jgi:uncharacterized membrane protein